MDIEFSVLFFAKPGGPVVPIGILLFDRPQQQLRVRLRANWADIADRDDAEILACLSDELVQLGKELGAQGLLEYLNDTLSHSIRITDAKTIFSTNPDATLDNLFQVHVDGNQNNAS
jgi:Protein of unknown function (DUF3037)